MENFKQFFSDKTPNTSGHMHSVKRMTEMGDRKHLNFVPRSASKRKDLDVATAQTTGRKIVTPQKAQELANKHGFKLQNLPRKLNAKWDDTTLCFDSEKNQYYLTD